MHIVTTTHTGSVPEAPPIHATLVSPRRLPSVEALALISARRELAPPSHSVEYTLDYPPVSPDPRTALGEVMRRYADCERCHLSSRRTRIVYVKGNPDAVIAAVGEGPGKDEDVRGIPFVGRSGRLQDELFGEANIDPLVDVCWLNIVGCRPSDSRQHPDRPPSLIEKAACSERTLMLLRAIRPRVVLCLGEQAAGMFWDDPPPPNTWASLPARRPEDTVTIGVVRHPAYLLRTIGMQNTYKEYAAVRLFLRSLREMLDRGLQKVSTWDHGLRYLATVVEPMVE